MQSITHSDRHINDTDRSNGVRTQYSYALKVQPCDLYEMDREQLLQISLELLQVVLTLLNFVYSAKAEASTRLAAIDLFVTSVRRTARRTMESVTTTFPVVLERDIPGSVSKRLGLHRNTVSKAYQVIEAHGGINREYEGEVGSQHLRIAIQPDFLQENFTIEDKKERMKVVPPPAEEEQEELPQEAASSIPAPQQCICCGSEELYVVCRPCGHLESLSSPMDGEDLQKPHNHFTFDLRLVTQHTQQEYEEEAIIPETPLHHDGIEPTLSEAATRFYQDTTSRQKAPVQFVPVYPRIIKESTLKIDDCGHDHGPVPSCICWECKQKTWSWNHLKDCWMCNWCYGLLQSEVNA